MKIVDTHAYYGRSDFPKFNFTIDQLRQAQKNEPGTKFVAVSASPTTNYTLANKVRENGDVLVGGYLQVIPKFGLPWKLTTPREIDELLREEEILGLNITTRLVQTAINESSIFPYVELAIEHDKPVLIHICKSNKQEFTSYEKNLELIERYPEAKIILEHFGGLNKNYVDGSMTLLREHENVYANTTGMSGEVRRIDLHPDGTPKMVEHEWEDQEFWSDKLKDAMQDSTIRDKVLLGTDYPYLSSEKYDLGFTRRLSPRDIYKMSDNAYKVFNLDGENI